MTDPLEALDVKEPCTESWEHMKGDARTRHCERCNLSVYNLSEMTREEAQAVLRVQDPPCIRFIRRADGTVLTRDCTPLRHSRPTAPGEARTDVDPSSGMHRVDLRTTQPEPEALSLLRTEFAMMLGMLPLRRVGNTLVLAVAEVPTQSQLRFLHDLRSIRGLELELVLADEMDLLLAFEQAYGERPPIMVMHGRADFK